MMWTETWAEIVQRFLGGSGSKIDAKNRLLLVLQDDRLGLTPEKKEALRKDILAAVRKHIDIDPDGFNMEFIHHSVEENEMRVSAPVQAGARSGPSISK